MSGSSKKIQRPLSPHLQVYKPQMTSVLSILHRMTGFAMAVGILVVVWMLVAAASGEQAYNVFLHYVGSKVGMVLLFGWSVAFFYHMSNGIRHLFWDMGYLFKLQNAFRAGYVVLLSTVVLTGLLWWTVCPFNVH
ncbi:MAG: succinate dehydrogenase, cytochrome b556 subunit [Alphaproteobacteria bacterium]|nr:succinate dehydrogenase, cytochrome b556 subunit [Alphaproteobacteria bacterium]MDP7223180.1 succinate dehydrogenase, cytochrome b556 subunit [Alphaproteobacteria bacterium]